jgi:pyruvate kinase
MIHFLNHPLRHTKIIATLGPASSDELVLTKLIQAGVNVFRINLSHGDRAGQARLISKIRGLRQSLNSEIGILMDLQGPKIRIAKFKNHKINLKIGELFILDPDYPELEGTVERVGLNYPELASDLKPNDILLLNDGQIQLQITAIQNRAVMCKVLVGGILSDNKGVNKQGGGLSMGALTEADKQDIIFAAEQKTDYLAISFVRSAQDVIDTRTLLIQAGWNGAGMIPKIERVEALNNLDQILAVSDGVMVARGDLAVEVGFAKLPGLQKLMIQQARTYDIPVITATQMMESMITSGTPTRAEVSDVANAVIDGTDAVMLSAETAVGDYPVETVKAMSEICLTAEQQCSLTGRNIRFSRNYARVDEAIAMAAMFIADHLPIRAIVALTESGYTPRLMSRIASGIPVYGVSRKIETIGKMTLYQGVFPVLFDMTKYQTTEIIQAVLLQLQARSLIQVGDQVLITCGDIVGIEGHANTLKLLTV